MIPIVMVTKWTITFSPGLISSSVQRLMSIKPRTQVWSSWHLIASVCLSPWPHPLPSLSPLAESQTLRIQQVCISEETRLCPDHKESFFLTKYCPEILSHLYNTCGARAWGKRHQKRAISVHLEGVPVRNKLQRPQAVRFIPPGL